MKAATPGIVWQWQCDYCYRYFGPKAATEAALPTFSQMVTDGWSIGKVHGDVCPSCMADGVQPSSERHPANTSVDAAVRADTQPREVEVTDEVKRDLAMISELKPEHIGKNDFAIYYLIKRLAAALGGGVDTDTHWANGLPRLLTPEAYNRLSAQRLAKQAALAESNEAGS